MSKQWSGLVIALLAVVIAMAAGFGVAMLATTVIKQPTVEISAAPTAIAPTSITDIETATAIVDSVPTAGSFIGTEPSIATAVSTPTASAAVVGETPASAGEQEQPIIDTDSDVRQAIFAEDTFSSSSSGWPVHATDTWSAQYVDGRYQLTLKGKPTIGFSFPLPTDQYRLGVDVGVRGGSAGIVFLFAEPSTFYQLVIDEQNRYAVQRVDGDVVTNLVDWTPSESIGPSAENRLRVRREGTLVHFFANEELLTDFVVPPGEVVNRYGFVLSSQNGEAEATFDNLVGQRLLVP